VKTVLLY